MIKGRSRRKEILLKKCIYFAFNFSHGIYHNTNTHTNKKTKHSAKKKKKLDQDDF